VGGGSVRQPLRAGSALVHGSAWGCKRTAPSSHAGALQVQPGAAGGSAGSWLGCMGAWGRATLAHGTPIRSQQHSRHALLLRARGGRGLLALGHPRVPVAPCQGGLLLRGGLGPPRATCHCVRMVAHQQLLLLLLLLVLLQLLLRLLPAHHTGPALAASVHAGPGPPLH